MTDIFLFRKPVDFLKAYIMNVSPSEKRGINNRLAQAAGVFPSYFSLILRGERTLNSDQVLGIANYLHLGPWHKRYFLRMVELERAASQELKRELEMELSELREKFQQISGVVNFQPVQLSDLDLTRFYSSWTYAAVRLATALPNCRTLKDISAYLKIPEPECEEHMRFLVEKGRGADSHAPGA